MRSIQTHVNISFIPAQVTLIGTKDKRMFVLNTEATRGAVDQHQDGTEARWDDKGLKIIKGDKSYEFQSGQIYPLEGVFLEYLKAFMEGARR